MRMPGFAAETSLYKTSEFYRLTADRGFPIEERAAVLPQSCGFFDWIKCAGAIASCIATANPVECITTVAPACLSCVTGLF
jgi:hypothetical protein